MRVTVYNWKPCEDCGDLVLENEKPLHRCPPIWELWVEDWYGDDYQLVYAHTAEDAVERWAEESDDERDLLDSSIEVKVRKKGEAEWSTVEVGAQTKIHYWTRKSHDHRR